MMRAGTSLSRLLLGLAVFLGLAAPALALHSGDENRNPYTGQETRRLLCPMQDLKLGVWNYQGKNTPYGLEYPDNIQSRGTDFGDGPWRDRAGNRRLEWSNRSRAHHGVDTYGGRRERNFQAPFHVPVYAVSSGGIVGLRDSGGYGFYYRLTAGDHIYHFAHMKADAWRNPANVAVGTLIGHQDETGNAERGSAHVHFETLTPASTNNYKDRHTYANPDPAAFLMGGFGFAAAGCAKTLDELWPKPTPQVKPPVAENKGAHPGIFSVIEKQYRDKCSTGAKPVLKRGMKDSKNNKCIAWVQSYLVYAHYYDLGKYGDCLCGVDGVFGKKTEKAVIKFKKAHGITTNTIPPEAAGWVTVEMWDKMLNKE